jgi:hypothetical protein
MKFRFFLVALSVCVFVPTTSAAIIPYSFLAQSNVSCPVITQYLSLGSRSAEVSLLQRYLISEKFLVLDAPTQYFGKLTETSVKVWQAKHGIETTGTVGPKTRTALRACIPTVTVPTVYKKDTPTKVTTPKVQLPKEKSVNKKKKASSRSDSPTPTPTPTPTVDDPLVTSIRMPEYWPSLAPGKTLIKHLSTDKYGPPFENMRSRYSGQMDGSIQKQDFVYTAPNVFSYIDTWYLKTENGTLLEYRDDLSIDGVISSGVYIPGKEINWGNIYTLSGSKKVTEGQFIIDPTTSSAAYPETAPNRYGYAYFKLENILPTLTVGSNMYKTVAVVYHYQTVCLDNGCDTTKPIYNSSGKQTGGAFEWELRFWLAPGKGIIQTEYISNSQFSVDSEKGRIDYVSKICNGTSSDYFCP